MMRGALIDANLLCLLTVGVADPDAIASHPRLKVFDEDDFEILGWVLEKLGDLVLCPQVLAETSNLLGYRQSNEQAARWRESLAQLVLNCSERNEAASQVTRSKHYSRLGFTDAALLILAAHPGVTLVSDDLPLCLAADRSGLRTANYNYIRDGAIDIETL